MLVLMSIERAQSALEALAKSRIAETWESTLSLLERGKEEDDRGAWAAACLLYSEAISGLQTLLELEDGERRVSLLQARLQEYGARLAELNTAVRAGVMQAPSSDSGADAGDPRIVSAQPPRAAVAELANARLCAEMAM